MDMRKEQFIQLEPGVVRRHPENPIITAADIPYPAKHVYNPAAVRHQGRYALILRVTTVDDRQVLGLAFSSDGVHFTVEPEPVMVPDHEEAGFLNDPRVTRIGDMYYLTYCSDPHGDRLRNEGIYLCMARSRDLRHWERFYRSLPDNRNAVLFPEKIGGNYVRLERPFRRGYRREHGYDIWLSESPDLVYWGKHRQVLSFLDVEWGSHKIGPAAPPIRTPEGWLTLFHGASIPAQDDFSGWTPWAAGNCKVYAAGVMLLDLHEPWKIRKRYSGPLLAPQADYELNPEYRPNVVFPCGMIPEPDGTVKIYYGASDICIALAEANIGDLVRLCLEQGV